MNSWTTPITILLACAMMAAWAPADGAEKPNVVISLSASGPDTAYWRLYAEWLELRPFDGVVLEIDPDNLEENSYFSPGRFQRALYWALQFSDGYVWV